MAMSVPYETKIKLNITVNVIPLLLLLFFSNTKAQSQLPNNLFKTPTGSYLQIVPSGMYLNGYTLYRLEAIGVVADPNEPKVSLKSELNFPLEAWLAGGQLQYTFPVSKQHAMSVSTSAYTNIGNNYGQMTDRDWINDIQIGYTEAPKSDLKALHTTLSLKYHFLNTPYSAIYLLGRVLYQRFELKNRGYWGWTVNYQTNVLYVIQGDPPTVNYTVHYLNPQLGMGFRLPLLQSHYFELESSAGATFARDEDDHILRRKLSKGKAWGFSTLSIIKFHLAPLAIGNHSLFIDLYGNLHYIYAKGNQTQHWYADRDQPAGTTIKGIPYRFKSLQYSIGISVGLNFNLSGQGRSSPSYSLEKPSYDQTDQQEEISYQMTRKKLIIRWKPVKNALYDVYGKSVDSNNWIKLNEALLSENHITFTEGQIRGHFQFKVDIHSKGGYSRETKILNIVFDN